MTRARLYLYVLAFAASLFALCGAYPSGTNAAIWGTRGAFGDMSAGTSGVCTVASGTSTMVADQFCKTLHVSSGGTLATANFRLFADTCQIDTGGTVDNSGPAASGITGGAAPVAKSLWQGTSGGNGCQNISGGCSGTAGTVQNAGTQGSLAGGGGAGGALAGTTTAAGGAQTTLGVTAGGIRADPQTVLGTFFGALAPGGGLIAGGTGGGGGGQTTGSSGGGGGGGAGGGVMMLSCRQLTGGGTISANGGAGAAGVTANASGGGGGGGGVIFLNVGDTTTWTGSFSVAGGTGGTGVGTGGSGGNGIAGTVVQVYQ